MSEENSYPSKRYSSYVLVVLLLAHIVAFLDRQILALLIEPIKTELSVTDTQLGFLHGFAFAIFIPRWAYHWDAWQTVRHEHD